MQLEFGKMKKNLITTEKLINFLEENINSENYVFEKKFLEPLELSVNDLHIQLLVGKKRGLKLERIGFNIYAYDTDKYNINGNILYKIAKLIKPEKFKYLSVENALAYHKFVDDFCPNYLTFVQRKGDNYFFDCKKYGFIEILKTKCSMAEIENDVVFDENLGVYVANLELALQDMGIYKRDLSSIIDKYLISED